MLHAGREVGHAPNILKTKHRWREQAAAYLLPPRILLPHYCTQVYKVTFPPAALTVTVCGVNPEGHDILPAGPGGPTSPLGP
jgi:hypothetical protein